MGYHDCTKTQLVILQAEVGDDEDAVAGDEHVGGLEVAVAEAGLGQGLLDYFVIRRESRLTAA